MKIVQLDDSIAATEQLLPADFAAVTAAGYGAVINNRPDGEVPEQPSSADLAAAAAAAGLAYYHMPVTAADFPSGHSAEFAKVLAAAQQPVLAFCRTGTRSTNLWVVSRCATVREAAAKRAAALGYDLTMANKACPS